MNYQRGKTLTDVGEFALLDNILFPAAFRAGVGGETLGDDCAFLELGDKVIAVSADVGPRPLVQQLSGHERDFAAAGWHAVVATASDIATAAAKPWFLVDTIDAPPDLPVEHLEEFVDGYFSACAAHGFKTAGGDLRQGSSLVARVFGVGLVEHRRRIGRTGAAVGDHLVLLGPAGAFISAFLKAERLGARSLAELELERLRFPRAQGECMQLFAAHDLIVAASDSSDGVLGAIENIAKRSLCAFELHLESASHLSPELSDEARIRGVDPWNLFFFWGDWSITAVIPQALFARFESVAAETRCSWLPLGRVVDGGSSIAGIVDGRRVSIRPLRNENFLPRSFNAGVRAHVEEMLRTPLFSSSEGK